MAKAGSPPASPERIARILTDSAHMGPEKAAKEHGVSRRTVDRYRASHAADPAVAELVQEMTMEVRRGWYKRAREVRRQAIDKLAELIQASRELRDVSDALQKLNEIVVGHEVLNGKRSKPRKPDGAPADAGKHQGPSGPGDD
jgi:predicted regulator of amino acid metabolism with ACT domain